MIRRGVLLLVALVCGVRAEAQKVSISTNILNWADLATINGEFSFAVARHVSLTATGQYNGWNFGSVEKGNPFQDRVRGGALGMRYWTWNVFSGWWFGLNARCEEYNRGGLFGKKETEEGFAIGVGLSLGYTYMLSRHWNLDFGIGGWCGGKSYTTYACPRCGTIIDKGRTFFAMPSADTQISIVYIF